MSLLALGLAPVASTPSSASAGELESSRISLHSKAVDLTDLKAARPLAAEGLDTPTQPYVTKDGEVVSVTRIEGEVVGPTVEETVEAELLAAVSAKSGVHLDWSDIEESAEYSVYRDGRLLGVVKDSHYSDPSVKPGASHSYLVEGIRKLPPRQVHDPDTGEVHSVVDEVGYSFFTPVTVPFAGTLKGVERAAEVSIQSAASKTTTFQYKTFIAEPKAWWIPTCTGDVGWYFAGDNRGYSSTTGSSRTHVVVTANWASKKLTHSKAVGPTKLYNEVGLLYGTKTASSSNIKVNTIAINATLAKFQIDHLAQDPFCPPVGGVWYKITFSMYKSGQWIASGSRRPVPHHEAYVRHDAKSWYVVLRAKREWPSWQVDNPKPNMLCLLGICGNRNITGNGSF
ncbi:MAG: hypothetical protein GX593_12825 [Actinomycetales bacterium]|nr:hypothetical protein [Actinomycetales bacterium]